ncbi:MAG: hypothetical protein J3R72DRAFT_434374 [Linnemannia gamsii]|nr:MAG: hypothetical protein J3R72DRAFT_434374 [Linnemannia gamsii]
MSSLPPPTELDTVAIHPLSPSQTQLFSSQATVIATTTAEQGEDWREELSSNRRPIGTLGNNCSSRESHGAATVVHSIHDDDAITRHQIYTIGITDQQEQQQEQQQQLQDGLFSRPPLVAHMTRSRRRSSSRATVDYSVPSFRLSKTEASLCADQSVAACEIHDHHGTTAIAEEEAALEHSAALIAAKQAELLAQQRMDDIEAAAGVGTGSEGGERRVNSGVGAAENGSGTCCIGRARSGSSSCLCLPPPRHHHLLNNIMMPSNNNTGDRDTTRPGENGSHGNCEESDEYHDEEEEDHFLSGLCLPRSQFFQTSVICSNTMARDALANERTFLSWLNVSIALCLVSFTFISKSLTLDSVRQDIGQDKDLVHKDHLSLAVGYVCFAVAFFAAIYSPLKYLRNIRRISTRYPFAQAGKWTFTVGMILGTLIMTVLVLAYTTMPH